MRTAIVFDPAGDPSMKVANDWETSIDLLCRNRSQKTIRFFTTWFFDYIQPTFLFGFHDNELEDILDGTGMVLSEIKDEGKILLTRDLLLAFANLPEDVFKKCQERNFYFDLYLKIHEDRLWEVIGKYFGSCQIGIGEDQPEYVPEGLVHEVRGDRHVVYRDEVDENGRENINEYIQHYNEVVAPVNAEYKRIYGV